MSGVLLEPQPKRITVAASAGPTLLNPPVLNIRIAARALPSPVATIARLRAPAHVRNRHWPSHLQERGLIDGGDLFQQIIQVAPPVPRPGDPRQAPPEAPSAPPVRHPPPHVHPPP